MSHHSCVRCPKTTPIVATRGAVAMRHEAVADDLAGRRGEDAGEHLDRRGLAGAVGPDVADHLAGADREGDVGHGGGLGRRAPDERAQRRGEPLAPPVGAEDLGQPLDADHRLRVRLDHAFFFPSAPRPDSASARA
jgi:hypothetical protein